MPLRRRYGQVSISSAVRALAGTSRWGVARAPTSAPPRASVARSYGPHSRRQRSDPQGIRTTRNSGGRSHSRRRRSLRHSGGREAHSRRCAGDGGWGTSLGQCSTFGTAAVARTARPPQKLHGQRLTQASIVRRGGPLKNQAFAPSRMLREGSELPRN